MPDSGISYRLPARYRLALALSLALFIHTLLASLFPLLLQETTPKDPPTLRFELVPPGSQTSLQRQQSSAEPGQAAAGNAVSPFAVDPLTAEEQQRKEAGRRKTVAQEEEATPETGQPSASASAAHNTPSTEETATPGATSTPTQSSRQGQATPTRAETTPDATISSVDLPEKETDPYLLALIARLAEQLKAFPLPELRQLERPVYVTVELQLMSNGTLVRADLTRRSGVNSLDRAAYRAALGASPYPEPPHNKGRQRYRVNLVFSPERL
jgi:protein TonB